MEKDRNKLAESGLDSESKGTELERLQDAQGNGKLVDLVRRLQSQIATRAKAEEQLECRNRELALLNKIITATTSTLDTREILEVACRELALAFRVPHAVALVAEDEARTARVVAEYLTGSTRSALGFSLAIQGNELAQAVVLHRRPQIVRDPSINPAMKSLEGFVEWGGTAWLLLLPLSLRDRFLGLICLLDRDPTGLSREEVEISGNVAAAVSQSLFDSQLFQEEREQRALARALWDTAEVLNSSLDLEEVLDRILAHVGRVVPHDSANIMLVTQDVGKIVRLRGYQERGTSRELISRLLEREYDVGRTPLLSRMRDTLQPVWVPDTNTSEEWIKYPDVTWIRSYVGSPVSIDGTLIGFINLNGAVANRFTRPAGKHLQAFANQAALAIHNARLHRQVEEHAEELEMRVAARTRELEAANRVLRELTAVKDEFVSSVSHELRTPITNLLLRQDLIDRKPEDLEKHLAIIRRETKRLHRIIEDLLQLSRLDREQVSIERQQVDLNSLVEKYVADRQLLAEERRVSLKSVLSPDVPQAFADEALLGQVLSILLTNALNYGPEGTRIEVQVVRPDDGKLETGSLSGFAVVDDGPGIAVNEQAHIFKRFFRGRVAVETGTPGTGLGLAIVEEIVRLHGGSITVFSEGIRGKGASFTVLVPTADAASG